MWSLISLILGIFSAFAGFMSKRESDEKTKDRLKKEIYRDLFFKNEGTKDEGGN